MACLIRSILLLLIVSSNQMLFGVTLWGSTEFIWNLRLASCCKVGCDLNPHLYFSNGEKVEFSFFKMKIQELNPGDRVWVHHSLLVRFYKEVLPHLKTPIVVVINGGDSSFPSDYVKNGFNVKKFLSNENILHVFAQNCDYSGDSDKVTGIPIGIDFHSLAFKPKCFWGDKESPQKQEEGLKRLLSHLKPTDERKLAAYVDFQLNDSMHGTFKRFKQFGEDRSSIFRKIISSGMIDYATSHMPRQDLWEKKGEYAFSVSPHGNGLDCHRTWEDLVLGCIVIVKTSPLDRLYEGLPVVIVQDWNEINEENMKKWLNEYGDAFTNPSYRERLTHRYWMNKIKLVSN